MRYRADIHKVVARLKKDGMIAFRGYYPSWKIEVSLQDIPLKDYDLHHYFLDLLSTQVYDINDTLSLTNTTHEADEMVAQVKKIRDKQSALDKTSAEA